MAAVTVVAVIAVGVGAGLASGLVWLGGGALVVPFLRLFCGRPDLFGVLVPLNQSAT